MAGAKDKNKKQLLKDEKAGMVARLSALQKKIREGKAKPEEQNEAQDLARALDSKKYRTA